MKKITLALFAGAASLAAASAFAGHHEGDGMKKDGDHAAKHAEHMAKMEADMAAKFAATDTDGSGTVSKEEYMAAKMAEAEASWAEGAEFLGDDGEASLDEVKAYTAAKMAEKKAKKAEHKAKHKEMHEDKDAE